MLARKGTEWLRGGKEKSCRNSDRSDDHTNSGRSSSSGDSFEGGPRFIPGRAGVTVGYLLPLARELQFNFEEPPDTETAECDRFHALMLLACWEETAEAEEQAAFWVAMREGERPAKKKNVKLKGAIKAHGLALKLQAAKERQAAERHAAHPSEAPLLRPSHADGLQPSSPRRGQVSRRGAPPSPRRPAEPHWKIGTPV